MSVLLWVVCAFPRSVYRALSSILGSVRGPLRVALGGVICLAGAVLYTLACIAGSIFCFMASVLHILLRPVVFLPGVGLLTP